VVRFGRIRRHRRVRNIPISPRTDAPADHDRRLFRFVLTSNGFEQADRLTIGLGERRGCVAQSSSPVGIGPPGRALENEAGPEALGDVSVGVKVLAERRRALRGLQQIECGEIRQLQTFVEDERRLDTAIGEKQPATSLRKLAAVLGHMP